MMNRLDDLEATLIESRRYPEITQLMGDLRVEASLYTEPLKIIERGSSVLNGTWRETRNTETR